MRIVILHSGYGCDSGCCGHVFEVDGEEDPDFEFHHPLGGDDTFREWAEDMVRRKYGAEHVTDLDWEHCVVGKW